MPSVLMAWALAFGLAGLLVAVVAIPLLVTGLVHLRGRDLAEATAWLALAIIVLAQITSFA